MPTFKSEAFHLVSKLQLVKQHEFLSSKGIHGILCYFPYVILPGADAEQSNRNFLTGCTGYTRRRIFYHVLARLKEQRRIIQ